MSDEEIQRFATHHQAPPPRDLHVWRREQDDLLRQLVRFDRVWWFRSLWARITGCDRHDPALAVDVAGLGAFRWSDWLALIDPRRRPA